MKIVDRVFSLFIVKKMNQYRFVNINKVPKFFNNKKRNFFIFSNTFENYSSIFIIIIIIIYFEMSFFLGRRSKNGFGFFISQNYYLKVPPVC